MDKRGRKVSLIGLLGGFVLISTVLIFLPKQEKSIEIRLESPESSFYQEGNVQSRLDYERKKLVDPETGEIPENIRAEELKFARHLDFQEQEMKARMAVAGDESAQQAEENVWTSIGPKKHWWPYPSIGHRRNRRRYHSGGRGFRRNLAIRKWWSIMVKKIAS